MKQYNPNAVCPKCGCKKIETRYCKGSNYDKAICYDLHFSKKEHLDRHCTNCHYEWIEACIDEEK